MKKLITTITIGAGLTLLAPPSTAHAQVDPYLNNSIPSQSHPVFNPWTGTINPQTITNQQAIVIASGFGYTVCYGSRDDVTWNAGGTASVSASAWQTNNGGCGGTPILDYVLVSTAPVFNDVLEKSCNAVASGGQVASAWLVSNNCAYYAFGNLAPWDVRVRPGNWRQFTCVTTPRWQGCHSPVNHWIY